MEERKAKMIDVLCRPNRHWRVTREGVLCRKTGKRGRHGGKEMAKGAGKQLAKSRPCGGKKKKTQSDEWG